MKQTIKSILAGLAMLTTAGPTLADQENKIDLARSTDKTSLVRLATVTTELPLKTEAYTMTDIIPGEETSHASETTAITPLYQGFGPVTDVVLSSEGDYWNTGVGYSGQLPFGTLGAVFYTPFTTGDGPTFGAFGFRPINDDFSLEGFYLRQFLDGQDFYSGEIQGNVPLTEGIDAFATGAFTSEGNSARIGVRIK